MGQAPGRNAEKQDVAFQFKTVNGVVSGTMFGDEFDVPLESIRMDGDNVTFSVTTTNYYSGSRLTITYSGTVSGRELHLVRQRKDAPVGSGPDAKANDKQSFVLVRIVPSAVARQ